MPSDSRVVTTAKQLLDVAVRHGFYFVRIAPGEDGPLRGTRETFDWIDEIYLGGFSDSCSAVRRRKSSLIVPGGLPVADQVAGDALTVLHTVVTEWANRIIRSGRRLSGSRPWLPPDTGP